MGQNVITINGQHYDAKTGQLLPAGSNAIGAKRQNGAVLDGFSRRPTTPKHIVAAQKIHSKTEKSKTLMRGAVKKPQSTKLHVNSHIGSHSKKPAHHAVSITNSDRVARASSIQQSGLISRFGTGNVAEVKKLSAHKSLGHVPVKNAPPISEHQVAPITNSFPNPFATAIDNATSHQETSPKRISKRHRVARKLRISPKTLSFGSFVLAGVLLTGFFIYQNIPNMAMRVAAARSGVNASLPGYKPAGFAMNGAIKYSAGKISVNYKSNTDERNFAITQSNSEWNDEALLDNFVASERRTYQTYQDSDKTIYIYDDNNATWVNDGVWYQVEGNSSLNSDQLLRIANSL